MDFVNAVLRTLAGYSQAVMRTLFDFVTAAIQMVKDFIAMLVNAYRVCRRALLKQILRIARFFSELWRFYLLATACVVFIWIMGYFLGTLGYVLAIALIGLLFFGAIRSMRQADDDQKIDVRGWDHLSETKLARRAFDVAIFLLVGYAALGFNNALPKPIHVALAEKFFSSEGTGDARTTVTANEGRTPQEYKWELTNDAFVSNNELLVRQAQTDVRSWASLRGLDPQGVIVSFSWYPHAANRYFHGTSNLWFVSSDGRAFYYSFGLQRSDHAPDYGNEQRNFDRPKFSITEGTETLARSFDNQVRSSDLFDKWSDVQISHDKKAGSIGFDILNDGERPHTIIHPALKNASMTGISFGSYGWWQGHYVKVKDFRID